MRGRGIGWKAERCAAPETCDLHLCVADDEGAYWHPADPLAFAKWRVRADIDAIPAHVMIKVGRGWEALRRGAVMGARWASAGPPRCSGCGGAVRGSSP